MIGYDASAWQPGDFFHDLVTDFGAVKVTEGTQYVSSVWQEQANDLVERRLPLALYHFADAAGNTPQEELQHFLNTIGTYKGKALLILDVEGAAVQAGEAWAKAFLDGLTPYSTPVVYGSRSWTSDYVTIPRAGYLLWDNYPVAAPDGPHAVGNFPASQVIMHQWSTATYDHDVFYGDANTWRAYVNKQTPTTNPDDGGILKGTDDMLIGIQGKAGVRRGGLFYVSGGVAKFIGPGVPTGIPIMTDEAEIQSLQSHVTGLQ